MPTDFERELSELLHTVTPEPPDHLAPPRVATLPDASPADAEATVIELVPATGHAPRRRHRWSVLVAAAAVAALAAGVIALIQTSNSGHHPPGNHSPTTTNTPTAPLCRENQFAMGDGPPLARHGRAGIAHFSYLNSWATPCERRAPAVWITVAIGAEPIGGWHFPANAEPVQIPGHGQVVFTAHFRVTGRCHTVRDGGFSINVKLGATTGSWSLGVAGCRLTPLRVTQQIRH